MANYQKKSSLIYWNIPTPNAQIVSNPSTHKKENVKHNAYQSSTFQVSIFIVVTMFSHDRFLNFSQLDKNVAEEPRFHVILQTV